jgi:hypothetical protein
VTRKGNVRPLSTKLHGEEGDALRRKAGAQGIRSSVLLGDN